MITRLRKNTSHTGSSARHRNLCDYLYAFELIFLFITAAPTDTNSFTKAWGTSSYSSYPRYKNVAAFHYSCHNVGRSSSELPPSCWHLPPPTSWSLSSNRFHRTPLRDPSRQSHDSNKIIYFREEAAMGSSSRSISTSDQATTTTSIIKKLLNAKKQFADFFCHRLQWRPKRGNLRFIGLVMISAVVLMIMVVPTHSAVAASDATASLLTAVDPVATAAAASTVVNSCTTQAVTTTAAAAAGGQIQNQLFFLQPPVPRNVELKLCFRLLHAALMGGVVGKERSNSHKHNAGIRTMALVSLGAACFTICSMFGFSAVGSPKYDPSRMASNVATGVGFIGSGVITSSTIQTNNIVGNECTTSTSSHNAVHGLTTATAIWVSAAIGITCGVGMHYLATFVTATAIAILKCSPLKQKESPSLLLNTEKVFIPSKPYATSIQNNDRVPIHNMGKNDVKRQEDRVVVDINDLLENGVTQRRRAVKKEVFSHVR